MAQYAARPEYLSALGCSASGRDDLQLELLNEANRHIEALAGVRGDDSCDVRTAVRARDKVLENLMASLSNADPDELKKVGRRDMACGEFEHAVDRRW